MVGEKRQVAAYMGISSSHPAGNTVVYVRRKEMVKENRWQELMKRLVWVLSPLRCRVARFVEGCRAEPGPRDE